MTTFTVRMSGRSWLLGRSGWFHGFLAFVSLVWCLGQTGVAAPVLTLGEPSLDSSGLHLSWNSVGDGWNYVVQRRTTWDGGIWITPRAAAPWPMSMLTWTDPSPANQAYYRVIAVAAAQRGRLLSVTAEQVYTKAQLQTLFTLAGIPSTAEYDVRTFKLDYETVDALGARTQASGAVLLPVQATNDLPLVSYQHGTILRKTDAPSSGTVSEEYFVGIGFATTGYAAVMPDYLGLGDSPGLHPYLHAESEATACVDMLRATRAFCATQNVTLNGQLFLCGYSEGGHATMALQRQLEQYHADEFTVTACAPMAGPYDLSGATADDFLSGRAMPNPYYFIYLLAAYEQVYHLAPTLADLLVSPYDTTLPPLMDGTHDGTTVNQAMPSVPIDILKPSFLANFKTNALNPLRLALEDNDVFQWRPKAPVRLYHCLDDQDVPFINSQEAFDTFTNLGATNVQLIDPNPAADHTGCALPALLAAKAWFDSLRQ